MKLGGHIDYHGSRAYAPDLPSHPSESWLKRLAGPLMAWAEQLFSTLLKPGARDAAETVWLVRAGEKHFSMLGSDASEKRRRTIEALWPEGDARFRHPIGHQRDND